ncbi:MAG: glycosyl hydrolase family 8, partial [bacterium]|nr:glycosyl hydrolase family 8 [bacterium]
MESIISFYSSFFLKVILIISMASQFVMASLSSVTDYQAVFVEQFPHAVVDTTWRAYRDKIQKDGRTIDRDKNYLTTSEGQSYSLLRAVWMDDKPIFDQVLKWTNHNLRVRKEDKLFAWLWGKDEQGRWRLLTSGGGYNTAADADQDIALALIFAYKRWGEDRYLLQAKIILDDIWRQEVVTVGGKPYLVAGNWAKYEVKPTINPSYFSFAAYPIFAEVDPFHPWLELKDNSYSVLTRATFAALDTPKSVGIPPDWVSINRETGDIERATHEDKKSEFSHDAFRVFWRVALDWHWHKDERAKKYLEGVDFFKYEWKNRKKIYGIYSHDGKNLVSYEDKSLYGSILPYFAIVDPGLGSELVRKKIALYYNPDIEDFRADIGYYPQNWLWFGLALESGKLANLFATTTVAATSTS